MSLAILVAAFLPAALSPQNIFGKPAHFLRRPSSVSFWALDVSAGAGSISSPVLSEHPKNVSEIAMLAERGFGAIAASAPDWLLISMFSIATRELITRQVQEKVVPAIVTGAEAQPKALELSQQFRRNLDGKVQRMLQPAGYRNAENIVTRVVDGELNDLSEQIRDLNDVFEHEITKAVLEVAEVEVSERIQEVHLTASSP